jgi:rubredoxin
MLGTNLKGKRQVEMICPEEDFKDIQALSCPICGALASYHPEFKEFIDKIGD